VEITNIELTFLDKRLQCIEKVESSRVTDRLELLIVGNVNVRAHIMGRKAQADNQPPVSKDLFLITKDGVGELGVERGERLGFLVARLDNGDMNRIVGVARP
jgi:hypothetical protein